MSNGESCQNEKKRLEVQSGSPVLALISILISFSLKKQEKQGSVQIDELFLKIQKKGKTKKSEKEDQPYDYFSKHEII